MAIEKITMPKLGESVTEGTISSWLVAPGDKVEKYDALAEVLTDKVTAEVPSSFSGIVKELIAAEDETLEVGEVICTIETTEAGTTESTETSEPKQEQPKEAPKTEIASENSAATGRFSPAVLRLAGEHNIDLAQVSGTGKGGRITRKDILRYVENPQTETVQATKVSASEPAKPATVSTVATTEQGDKEIPVGGVRKAIAKHMVTSVQEIPHAWMMVEADATSLVRYRDKIKAGFKKEEGYNITYFAFFIKAVAQALKEFPELNSTWAGEKIIQRKAINISIAVATEDLLYVPVIKHADEKSIKGIAREITELANKARSGKLTSSDMEGGTFTVNSTGSFGSIQSMGIINHPQAAILQVESIVKRPVIIDEMIAVRDMVNLCLSIDHRILDGLIAGKFLQAVKANIEKISEANTEIY
ncbi:Dihydrolipoyllysine-residue acetyltransferase component of pyruvate dehydrogenase complex [Listeria grayi]|uniref:Dihydrolipoamide acetyltransferase component of pyruvate dehydrogenase complex n=1 Tax=Listeria grayi FSL F6-1183 TaxID=1265827 RepID=A0A829R8U9_LISGR|nr:dihydrolipoamide acetyltransferase family protein [Listeria grayi]EUJ30032.1 branched-chain alpha-keto acid dehydrogenase complex subunit E2 [Listeria grayi FSL F6-1183]VEI33922.1 Dihydrolipoyllysine-residue acetyltransferase component of pyruvate dehydrogenase complex [Listeria grayi]